MKPTGSSIVAAANVVKVFLIIFLQLGFISTILCLQEDELRKVSQEITELSSLEKIKLKQLQGMGLGEFGTS